MAEEKSKRPGWLRSLTPSGAKARGSKAPDRKQVASKETSGKEASSKETATEPTAPKPRAKPPPDMQGRIDGIQGWMAEIERKQGRMTYFGAAAGVLALALAGAALFLAITSKNDTSSDIDALRDDVNGLQQQVQETTDTQLKSLNDKMSTLEQQVTSLSAREKQNESDIAALQSQAQTAGKKGALGATPTSPAFPDTTVKP